MAEASLQTSKAPATTTSAAALTADAASAETTRAAGRGGLAIAVAKISFIVFGLAQQIILPRLLGVDGYGAARLVLFIVSLVNNVIVAVALQGVSRAVSQAQEGEADQAFRRALRVHVWLAMGLSLGFALAAGSIAEFVSAPHVTLPLRVGASIVLLYGIYAPLVGALNGRRRFLDQAGLDIGYGVIRLSTIVAGVLIFTRAGQSGVLGAIVGFAGAAAIIVPVAVTSSGLGKAGGERPATRDYLAFLVPLALGQLFQNALMQADSLLLSRFVGQAASAADLGTKAADSLRGIYGGAQLFAFLPYQMLMSITFILFPMLARAHAEGDRESIRGYTMTGVRLAFLLTGLMCAVVSGLAPHVLRLVFPIEMVEGGPALRVLSLGMGSFAILGIASAALTSLGRAREAAILTATALALVVAGCFVLVPRAAFGPAMLVQSAIATSLALTATAVVGGALLARAAGGFVAPATLARVIFALGVALAIGTKMPWIGKPGVVVEAIAVAAIYLAVLVGLREIGKQDLTRVKQVLGRK